MKSLRVLPTLSVHPARRTMLRAGAALLTALALAPATWALNECGLAVANAATCNGDGAPATDANPYALGITYTAAAGNPISLTLDGTATPLTITGGVFAQPFLNFPTTTTTLGPVSVIRSVPGGNNFGIGSANDSLANLSPININLSSQTLVQLTRTGAATFSVFYVVSAFNRNAATSIVSAATVIANANNGTTGDRPFAVAITGNDEIGGLNSVINLSSSGAVTVNHESIGALGSSSAQGVGAYSKVAGSPVPVTATNSGTIVVNQKGLLSSCFGLVASNAGAGGATATHSGSINVTGDCTGNSGITGLWAFTSGVGPATAIVNGTVSVHQNGILTGGARGVQATSNGLSTVDVNGDIDVFGANLPNTAGVLVIATPGTYAVTVRPSRTVNLLSAPLGSVISALATGGGTVQIDSTATLTNVTGAAGNAITTGIGPDIVNSLGAITGLISTGDGVDAVTLSGGSLNGGIDLGIGDDTATISAPTMISQIVSLNGGAGTDILNFNGITLLGFSGADNIANGSNITNFETINLNSASTLTLTGGLDTTAAGVVNIAATSTLDASRGSFTLTGSVNNTGSVSMIEAGAAADDILTISANYTGATGATLTLATVLNAGGGATQSDQLFITGNSVLGSGPTTLNITNVGGAGALTAGNGILLVSVSGTSAAGAFVLPGPGYIVAGGYRYYLVQVNGNWYLQSSGSITVTKVFTPPLGVSPGPYDFSFTAVCDLPVANSPYGPMTITGYTALNNTVTITGVPAGATCSVTETFGTSPPAGYAWGTPTFTALNPVGTVPVGGVQSTTVTNTLASGSLQINKTVSIPLPANATFNFTLTCAPPTTVPATTALGASVTTAQSISMLAGATNGSTAVIGPIATGSTCSVTEAAPTAITNYKWGTTPAAITGLIIANSATPTAVPVTNVLTPLDPPFISKRSRLIDGTTIEWTITVINNSANNAGQAPVAFNVTDLIPGNATVVSGSLACAPTGTPGQTTAPTCGFNVGNTNLLVAGTLAYTNASNANAATASERVDIVFRGTAAPGQVLVNTACTDLQNLANTQVCSAQNIISTPPLPVPTLDSRALAALMLLMLLAAAGMHWQVRRRG